VSRFNQYSMSTVSIIRVLNGWFLRNGGGVCLQLT